MSDSSFQYSHRAFICKAITGRASKSRFSSTIVCRLLASWRISVDNLSNSILRSFAVSLEHPNPPGLWKRACTCSKAWWFLCLKEQKSNRRNTFDVWPTESPTGKTEHVKSRVVCFSIWNNYCRNSTLSSTMLLRIALCIAMLFPFITCFWICTRPCKRCYWPRGTHTWSESDKHVQLKSKLYVTSKS